MTNRPYIKRCIFAISILMVMLCLPELSLAQATRYEVTHEGRKVNTVGSESGPVRIGDTLYYSSLQEVTESGGYIDFGLSIMRVFKSKVSSNGNLSTGQLSTFGINHPTRHTGNVAFDKRNQVIYFTRCKVDAEQPYLNEIYYTKLVKGSWTKPQKMSGDINVKGYNNTQPSVGELPDGSTILYFSSDRPGGLGGMDIWYTVITGDKPGPVTNLGMPVNSQHDEITPFYDNGSSTLYFSSNRPEGIGGFDVYGSTGSRNAWSKPTILPEPVNSKNDDLYFSVNDQSDNTPGVKAAGYLTSNRADSYFLIDTSCCHDIYNWQQVYTPDTIAKPSQAVVQNEPDTCPCKKARLLLPIRLYFHNDEPNPRSIDTVTSLTYFQTYNSYMFLRQKYRERQSEIDDTVQRMEAIAAIDTFFSEVQNNSEKFERFISLLAQDILDGRHVVLTVAGYASPLHNSAYNVNLSKRRISTIVNQLKAYSNGLIEKVMTLPGSGSLQIKEAPFGSSTAPGDVSSSPLDQVHSVYGVGAARERRIEILEYKYQ